VRVLERKKIIVETLLIAKEALAQV